MGTSSCRSLVFLLLTVPLSAHASPADTPTSPAPPPPSSTASHNTYDQIVRLSLVEGDVRVSRGKEAEHATGSAWGQAEVNLPVKSGFSLVTGKGRAEIEFEDASIVYLGEDSVLTFNQLTATDGVPRTDVTLVSGTATVNERIAFPDEWFILRTPTDYLSLHYPDTSFLRVNSYLDAMAVTPQRDLTLHQNSSAQRGVKGQTITYRNGQIIKTEASSTQKTFAEWDDWTAKRVAARSAAMSAVMKDSGLSAPIPGLAEMKDQGTFFACAPYGTCWQPTNGWEENEAAAGQPDIQQSSNPSLQQSATPASLPISAKALQSASPTAILRTEYDEPFPCSPDRIRYLIARDPSTGRDRILRAEYVGSAMPYDWAICHAGSWIHREHRYVWVAGTKRHHHCPVRWVKVGRTTGYVPIHPRDVAGKSPINLKHGVFEATGKKGESVQQVTFNSGMQVKLLSTTPKEFLKPYFSPLQHVETPRLEAHLVKDGFAPGRDNATKPTAISFDHKSQSITLARQVTQGGKNTMVTERFGGREANPGARSNGGWNGSSGSRTGDGGSGSYSHSSGMSSASRSGFSGGGGSHGGGFSGGGGGGSHASSGGGGGASSGGGASASSGSHK